MPDYPLPLVHLNGTSREALRQQLATAHTALEKALDALAQAAPHGRDYYPIGPDAYTEAAAEHQRRMQALAGVATDLLVDWIALTERPSERIT